jgi:hypothetical protein
VATPKTTGPGKRSTVEMEPVNEAQADASVAKEEKLEAPGAPSTGELEERASEAEERAEAAERRALDLQEEMKILKEQIAALMRGARQPAQQVADTVPFEEGDSGQPVFEESEPHGIVVGDERVAYVQNGHQFGRDRKYIATERHHGSPRAFNPRLVGFTKPRPGTQAVDALEGVRDR